MPEEADGKPAGAPELGDGGEVPPEVGADEEAEGGEEQGEEALLFADAVAEEAGEVDAHEADEGAEVEELGAGLVGEDEGAGERGGADEEDVAIGDAGGGMDGGEEGLGEAAGFTHAVHEAGTGENAAGTGADGGNDECEVDELEEPGATGAAGDVDVGGVDVGEGFSEGPNDLGGVGLDGGKDADDEADEYGAAEDVAAGIDDFFAEGGDAIEADVGEDGEGGAGRNVGDGKCFGVVEGAGEVGDGDAGEGEGKAGRAEEHGGDDAAHQQSEVFVERGGGVDVAEIEPGEEAGEEEAPEFFGDGRGDIDHGAGAPDGANDGIEEVVHEHGPTGEEAEERVDFLADVGGGGAGVGMGGGHAAVGEGGEEHADEADEDAGDDVAAGFLMNDAEQGHGGGGLDHDDPGEDEAGEGERAAKFGHWG